MALEGRAAPPGEAQTDVWIMAGLFHRLREMYRKGGGAFPDPLLNLTWDSNPVSNTSSCCLPLNGYDVLLDVVIPAGPRRPIATGTLEHSAPQDELFASTGLPNQEVLLPATPYLDGSAQVSAGNGDYVEVANFLGSTAADRHFLVLVDQADRATIRFGNGINGVGALGDHLGDATRPAAARRERQRRHAGQARRQLHRRPREPRVDLGRRTRRPASGGTDRQTIAQIQALAPESIRVLSRTVSREDYEVNACRLPEVARALMLTSNEDPGIAENTGILFVIPRGGGVPSPALKDAVKQQVTVVFPNTLTFQVAVQDPVYLPIDVQATVFLRQGANASVVRAAITKALADFFVVSLPDGTPNPQVDFGWNVKDAEGEPAGEVAVSDVFDVVRDVAGVRKIGDGPADFLLNGARADVVIGTREFPVLGQVALLNGETRQPL